MIGENCDVLPNIECLPITQGELDKVLVETAHALRKASKEGLERALEHISDVEKALMKDPRNKQLQANLETFKESGAYFEKSIKHAEQDCHRAEKAQAASAHTLPPKRMHVNKSGTKVGSSRTVTKQGKKTKTDTITTDAQPDVRADTPSFDVPMADADARSPSPPPPLGWKGKGKARAVSDVKTTVSKKSQTSSVTHSPPAAATTPPRQIQPEAPAAVTLTTSPLAAVPLPVTPNQPTSSSPRISTTRSAGRRLQLEQQQTQLLTQPRGVKREPGAEADADAEEEEQGGVTEKGSPVRKKPRRS
jgi:hypothetical protein